MYLFLLSVFILFLLTYIWPPIYAVCSYKQFFLFFLFIHLYVSFTPLLWNPVVALTAFWTKVIIMIAQEAKRQQQQVKHYHLSGNAFFVSTWFVSFTLKEKQSEGEFQYVTTLNQNSKHMQLIIYEPPWAYACQNLHDGAAPSWNIVLRLTRAHRQRLSLCYKKCNRWPVFKSSFLK